MRYQVLTSKEAGKTVERLNKKDFNAIAEAIDSLVENPWPEKSGAKQSKKGSRNNYYKIRVRNYRIRYTVDKEKATVYIDRIARRDEKTYRNL